MKSKVLDNVNIFAHAIYLVYLLHYLGFETLCMGTLFV